MVEEGGKTLSSVFTGLRNEGTGECSEVIPTVRGVLLLPDTESEFLDVSGDFSSGIDTAKMHKTVV